MGYSRPGRRVSRSFHVIRTSTAVSSMEEYSFSSRIRPNKGGNSGSIIAPPEVSCIGQIKLQNIWAALHISVCSARTSVTVLSMASPSSPAREYSYSSRPLSNKGGNSGSVIPPKDWGFQSLDPTSPEVSCIGQIKLKHKWVDVAAKDKENRNNNNNVVSKLKKLMLRKQQSNKKEEEEEAARKGEKERCSITTGSSTSGSYDAKFGAMFIREAPIVAKSGLLMSEPLPKPGPKLEGDRANPSIWKRRSMAALKDLDVNNKARVEGFDARKLFTT